MVGRANRTTDVGHYRMPLYPLCMWLVSQILGCSVIVAGIITTAAAVDLLTAE